jgi:hypothetical protein
MLHFNTTIVVEVLLRGAVRTIFDKTKRTAGESGRSSGLAKIVL